MSNWTCQHCYESNEENFEICWHCGYSKDGDPPDAEFTDTCSRDETPRLLACLRCDTSMLFGGMQNLPANISWQLAGGESTNTRTLEVYCCPVVARWNSFCLPQLAVHSTKVELISRISTVFLYSRDR